MEKDIMNIFELILLTFFFTVVRFCRRRRNAVLLDAVSYFIYFASIIEFIHGILTGHKKEMFIIAVILAFCGITDIAVPWLVNHIKNESAIGRIAKRTEAIYESVASGYALVGTIGWIFLQIRSYDLFAILFALVWISNIAFSFMPEEFNSSIKEERVMQDISLLFSCALGSIVWGKSALVDSTSQIFAVECVSWIVILTLYTLKCFDRNEGTVFWVLTSDVSHIRQVRFRTKRMFRRLCNNLLAFGGPVFSVMVFNTIEFYYVNMNTLEFRVSDFWGTLVVQAVLITVLFAILFTCISSDTTKLIGSVCLGLAVAGYIQVMIFNRDIGITDTYEINWSAYSVKMVVNILVWCLCVVVPVILYKVLSKRNIKVYSGLKVAMVVLLVLQLSGTAYDLVRCGGYNNTAGARPTEYYVSGENEFTISKEKNIVVFILDTFSNDFLDEMLDKYPDELDYLKDFTYYDNYDSKYDGTALAMNYLLTGIDFDNTVPCREYSKAAFGSDKAQSFYRLLKSGGYTCNLYTDKDTAGFVGGANIYGLFDNVKKEYAIDTVADNKKIRRKILKGALYRWLPLVVKRFSIVVTTDFDGTVSVVGRDDKGLKLDSDFYSEMRKSGIEVDNRAGHMMIYHFEGMHSFGNDRYSKNHNMAEAARGNLEDVYSYIDELKKLGVYDNTSIIITADHGVHETKNGIQPIFFIKRSGQTQDSIQINDAPVSAEEFMPTIVMMAGGDNSSFGHTIYDFKENEARERTVYVREKKQNISDVIRSDSTSTYAYLYGYTYDGDKETLREKDDNNPDVKLPLIDFWH